MLIKVRGRQKYWNQKEALLNVLLSIYIYIYMLATKDLENVLPQGQEFSFVSNSTDGAADWWVPRTCFLHVCN